MRTAVGLVCGCAVLCLCAWQTGKPTADPAERWLTSYRNDDGTIPDGQESARDDSSALQAALNAGPGIVRVGPGVFRIQNVTIPAGVTLQGAGSYAD